MLGRGYIGRIVTYTLFISKSSFYYQAWIKQTRCILMIRKDESGKFKLTLMISKEDPIKISPPRHRADKSITES